MLSAFFALIAFATLLDLLILKSGGFWFSLFKCLSLRRGVNKLFSTKLHPKQVYGLQVLNSLVIFVAVASHSYLYYIWLDAFIVYGQSTVF